ncbi:hypothetical protein ABW21_db0205856 [Orbilia brochopaga]|nr:hypothetical protein ABW21_db0205856 [Drechslerella brochopaga]
MVDHGSVVQTVRYSHPMLLLATLYASFASLVRNPPILLLQLLPVVAAVQIAHASVCLGASNNKTPSAGGKKKSRPATTKGKLETGAGSSVLPALLSLVLAALIGTPAMYAVMVLLGAPITSHFAHTVLCAAHLSLLAGYPLIYSYDVQGSKWREIFSLSLPIDEAYGGALDALIDQPNRTEHVAPTLSPIAGQSFAAKMDGFMDEKKNFDGIKSFDAFPKTRVSYTTRSSKGGVITLIFVSICVWLIWGEMAVFLDGKSEEHFSVQGGEGHSMQINLDFIVAMPCDTLHVNVQDAAGDRILAGDLLTKTPTEFASSEAHKFKLNLPKRPKGNSCRIYGSMDVNRVMGDFHITAKGHGYWEPGQHVDHGIFNFSHVVNELSFGEFYPKLVNPMDGVVASTEDKFYRYQYFLSIVPTTYMSRGRTLHTNQYSVTEQGRSMSPQSVPGIFFKFDVEPIKLTISDSSTSWIYFIVRLANVIGGVMVAGGWLYKISDGVLGSFLPSRRRGLRNEHYLNGTPMYYEDAGED